MCQKNLFVPAETFIVAYLRPIRLDGGMAVKNCLNRNHDTHPYGLAVREQEQRNRKVIWPQMRPALNRQLGTCLSKHHYTGYGLGNDY